MEDELTPDDSRGFAPRRPGFMLLTATVGAVVTAAFGLIGERFYNPREARAAELEEADQSARAEMLESGWQPIATKKPRGVELLRATHDFELPLGNGPIAGHAPGPESEARASALISDELRRYPKGLLEKARFRRVLLAENLSEAGHPIPSLPNYQRTLLLDVDAPADFLRRLLHHEIFHFVDYADDDQVTRDPEWERLNGRFFVYGSGGRFVRSASASVPDSTLRGFVTPYATSALEEDKAETFAFLMVEPGEMALRAAHDEILAAKIEGVKRQVVELCPSLKDDFWRRGGVGDD